MAKCYICEKKALSGNKRSHSNIATKRKFKANLQSKTINGKKRKICTSCIKTLNKEENLELD
ncbi:MAG: 50S ribosomal protein L28 [Candidatus Moraniibacteriota bacterium]